MIICRGAAPKHMQIAGKKQGFYLFDTLEKIYFLKPLEPF